MHFYRALKWAGLVAGMSVLSAMAFAEGTVAEPSSGATSAPTLLDDALNALLDHQGRWAFTETSTGVGRDGKPIGESIFRLDPSAPYAEQYKPIKVRGKPPTEKQLKEAAEGRERAAKRRFEQQQKQPVAPVSDEKPKVNRSNDVRLRISGQKVKPQIDKAKVVHEDETSATYEVPMYPEGDANSILDKFELTACVNKQTHQLERVTIRQREALRVKLIAKVTDSLITIEFTTPDPRYPSVPTKITADGRVAIFFGKAQAMHSESVRTELRHVTPYDERFSVKTGPMRTIEF